MSGQRVNVQESKMFCLENVTRRVARSISKKMIIALTRDLGKYMGVPLLYDRATKDT